MTLTMLGRLDPGFLLSYAVPAATVVDLLPNGLFLVTLGDHAFLNIVISRVVRMRPHPLPTFLGLTYWHIAYRLHVTSDLASGKIMTGLYFLRSDIDRALLVIPGNLLTDFRYHRAAVAAVSTARAGQIRPGSRTANMSSD